MFLAKTELWMVKSAVQVAFFLLLYFPGFFLYFFLLFAFGLNCCAHEMIELFFKKLWFFGWVIFLCLLIFWLSGKFFGLYFSQLSRIFPLWSRVFSSFSFSFLHSKQRCARGLADQLLAEAGQVLCVDVALFQPLAPSIPWHSEAGRCSHGGALSTGSDERHRHNLFVWPFFIEEKRERLTAKVKQATHFHVLLRIVGVVLVQPVLVWIELWGRPLELNSTLNWSGLNVERCQIELWILITLV